MDDSPDAPIAPPEGCVSPEEHERQFTAMAVKCEQLADAEGISGSTVAKLIAESLKARRAAAALATEREKLVVLARLDRSAREMKSGGNGRAPLRLMNGAQGH